MSLLLLTLAIAVLNTLVPLWLAPDPALPAARLPARRRRGWFLRRRGFCPAYGRRRRASVSSRIPS
ncbi:hypothetical protein FK513_30215, partial [Klebsiella pneumoniae]|nr:hypothetical protein [Klebsiella pneumoniae]